ncbi:M23 family metallopeptidase [Streptomyces sp. NPDC059740]|uniref:M23 family metallopeptidase n=1 Tax=Streptomyces sp. NPDC059740 TaxID=3346926 RepID=UPI003652459A
MAFGRPLAGNPEWWRGWWAWPVLVAAVGLTWAAGRVGTTTGDAGVAAPVEVDPPVRGRWAAQNSPANRVPSHGTRSLAQTYAIDIVAEPEPGSRPRFGWWPPVRRNTDFPAFGAPLLAVGDATVVRVRDGHRDHLSRNSWLLLPYFLLVEGAVRSVGGPGRIIGNHLVLDLGGGVHALYAHLRQGSARVREGERVRAGQPLAECGDSGNSTEPHLHFQLQDHPDPQAAQGLPFRWRGIGVPRNRETFTVPDPD